ncbi:MAG: hypothetical protein R3F61_22350 [Myxococcota bacterium]
MTRWITFGAASSAIIFSLACGGGSFANQAACKSYIEAQNALPCMKMAQTDASQICPDQLDMSPVDMTEYYGCLEENAKCNGDIPDLAGQANCSMPTM